MANNIDRLFRENLDQFEVTPSVESWNKVQQQIARKQRKGFFIPMSIAAAIIILIVASVLIIDTEKFAPMDGQYVSLDYSAPFAPAEFEVIIPLESPQIAKNNPGKMTLPTRKNPSVEAKSDNESFGHIVYEPFTVASINSAKLEVRSPALNLSGVNIPDEQYQSSIKITYIAHNQQDSTKTILGGFFASLSRDVSPTDLLADIRDVKDNLFSKN